MHVDKIKLNKKERKVMVARIWDSGILEASKVGAWEGVGVQEICAHIFSKYIPPNTRLQLAF